MQAAQAPDFLVDLARLHRAAAGAVDAQDHAGGVLVLERVLQSGIDALGARLAVGRDHAVELHQRGMLAGQRLRPCRRTSPRPENSSTKR